MPNIYPASHFFAPSRNKYSSARPSTYGQRSLSGSRVYHFPVDVGFHLRQGFLFRISLGCVVGYDCCDKKDVYSVLLYILSVSLSRRFQGMRDFRPTYHHRCCCCCCLLHGASFKKGKLVTSATCRYFYFGVENAHRCVKLYTRYIYTYIYVYYYCRYY